MFDGFTLDRVDLGDVTLRVRHGGSGPPLLLLHGHPRTHTTWHRVAPLLADRFTVICPDTRGYGESTKPPTTADHTPYSKRVMANDCVELLRRLGHERFFAAGHDRGACVATRLALDHPDAVQAVAILDSIPIGETLARCDAEFARAWYHWFFFAQPDKPERVITADPDSWYNVGTRNTPERLGEDNFADFHRAIHDPATVKAMLEDYRAGLGVDRAHDDADKAAGHRITCPTLVLWSSRDDLEDLHGDVLAIWRDWAVDLRGHAIDSGHHMAEENPGALAAALAKFFGEAKVAGAG
ncbi:haloacetate dehalogenase [Amycolatopsis xylanica]|uniref:Haloacetate dehalogenase n=1 Tax=Amycolatopsis xylanica TaxID=589385 RepID=A0A1H3H5H5_9PSEU|nr:alpha/beta hydrolase [Amycolatopsis xylanica]SDY10762.1 haloacetate dehalogenase [Amycolatopsis xylanica]